MLGREFLLYALAWSFGPPKGPRIVPGANIPRLRRFERVSDVPRRKA